MPKCYLLSIDELLENIDAGYTLVGGPYETEEECEAVCGVDPPITTTCCPDDPTPRVLSIAVTSGLCSGSGEIVYDDEGHWLGDISMGTGTLSVSLYCDSTWYVNLSGCATQVAITMDGTCSPFSLASTGSFSPNFASCCAGGTTSPITIVITE